MLTSTPFVHRGVRLLVCTQARYLSTASMKRQFSATSSLSSLSSSGGDDLDVKKGDKPKRDAGVPDAKKKTEVTRKSRKKIIEEPDPTDFPRTENEWKFGAHVSAEGGVQNTVLNAAKIGQVISFVYSTTAFLLRHSHLYEQCKCICPFCEIAEKMDVI